ncbi:MAG: glycine cleavage system protein GcvH [Pseudomonadota bacterium]
MSGTKYTDDHEWVAVDGDVATIGITNYAQEQLGDVVFVDLPDVDAEFSKGDEAGVIESVKAASELYAPVSGSVAEVNEALNDEPALLNSAPETDGWILKMKLSDAKELDELMDDAAYKELVASLE